MHTERRKVIRRSADREMFDRAKTLKLAEAAVTSEEAARELRHRRRHAIRHNCDVHIALKIAHVSGPDREWNVDLFKLKGRILDLSATGASIFTKHPLSIGQEVSVVIVLRDSTQIRATGRVRWTKGVPEKNGYACGLHFEQLSEKGRDLIAGFLRELERTIGL